MNYLLKTSRTFRTFMSSWNMDPCLKNERCPFGLGDNLYFQHYTKNINTSAKTGETILCVCVGGVWPCVSGSPNVCSVLAEVWEPAVVVVGGGHFFFCPRTTVTIHVGNSAPAMSIGIWLIHSQWVHVTRKYCLSGTRILHQAAEIKM